MAWKIMESRQRVPSRSALLQYMTGHLVGADMYGESLVVTPRMNWPWSWLPRLWLLTG